VAPGCHSNPPSTFGNGHSVKTSGLKAKGSSQPGSQSEFPLFHNNKEVPAYQVSGLDFIHQSRVFFFFIPSHFLLKFKGEIDGLTLIASLGIQAAQHLQHFACAHVGTFE
jgi:hypothetical protein